MHEYSLTYALFLFIAAGVSAVTAGLLWRRRSVPSAVPLFVFLCGLFVWSITYALYWLSASSPARVFWLDATYLGVVTAPAAVFVFMLYYTHREHWITRNLLLLLTIQPVLTLVILWTDSWHGLFFAGLRSADASAILDGGPWFWIHVVYSYGLLAISYGLLARQYMRSARPYRQQTAIVLFAFALPWLSNIIGIAGLNPLPDIDLTPLAFTLTGLILVYALFYKDLFDLVPVARDKVMETMREPVLVVDEQQRVVDINLAARRLLAETHPHISGDYIGLPVADCFPDWPEWIASDDDQPEIRLEVAGQTRYYERLITCLTDNHGRSLGSMMVLNNITRRKQAQERELKLTLERERMRLLTSFVQDAAHEFKTPLTVISSSVHLMSRSDDSARRAEKAAQVGEHVRRISRLVDMMIATVDLESRDTLRLRTVNVAAILDMLFASMINRYGHLPHLYHDIAPDLPLVQGQPDYLGQAIGHLLDNAYNFTPKDGSIYVSAWAEGDRVILEIRDTGPGLDADGLANVFRMFWRRDEAHTTPGFGLGLHIARRVIELHKGQITVDSPPGHGLHVRMTLPAIVSEAVIAE